jgi:predicted regulator of Ras-like GTPase activity (Roadblock/LC7/MglB family)
MGSEMNDDVMVEAKGSGLDWLLDDLVQRLTGAERAVVLSADGLLLGRSRGLLREDGEHLAAMASAFRSLARGVGKQFDKGEVQQTVVDLERGYLVVTEAGVGACLALLAAANADLGMVAYEMNVVVEQVGANLTASPRSQHLDLRMNPHAQ